jgi:hypothetical protein
LEGVSYLVVVAFALSSLWQKTKSGSSLPATQPSGLFGAAEGLSFVSVLAGLAVLGVLAADKGYIPNALPLFDYSAYVTVCH